MTEKEPTAYIIDELLHAQEAVGDILDCRVRMGTDLDK